METSHRKDQEERTYAAMEEIKEESFLTDLYVFMKKRDTPIERIPHLGFKQIDLFMMFKIVRELGGYHQVTAQQMWKQVYNTLGGNPRSTSAATCTRRHYEKLLLPYEYHMKGEIMNALPHQQKHFHFSLEDDGQRPAKRKPLPMSLLQNPLNHLAEPHASSIPLQLHYPHFYHPCPPILPPYVPVSPPASLPHSPPPAQSQFSYHPSPLTSTDRVTQPLEHLRYLAEQYKTSSGLAEPLNLCVKASTTANSNPKSSFFPPASSKIPKFLNKPSPLYPSSMVMRNDGCEAVDSEAGGGGYSPPIAPYSPKETEGNVVEPKSTTGSSIPMYDDPAPTPTASQEENGEGASIMSNGPDSPKTAFTRPRKEREASPEGSKRALGLNHPLPIPPQEYGRKMEIKIPLSLLQNWIRLYGPPNSKQLAPQEEHKTGQKTHTSDIFPTKLSFHSLNREWSSATDSLTRASWPPTVTQPASDHHTPSHHHFNSYNPSHQGSILKSASSRDVFPFNRPQDINNKPYSSKPRNVWDPYQTESKSAPVQLKRDSNPLSAPRDFTDSNPFAYVKETPERVRQRQEPGSSAGLVLNSGPTTFLHLSEEEVVKLRKIISSSS
ncbi:AT-rich interaction domain 6 [Genypterus blacodes]|uniref:AT-rich interaction domain 6 n=1 Tax=Genypterus blacodes TaxID=154954 RepID=UPI003F76DFC9